MNFDECWVEQPGPLDTPCHVWQRARKGKEAAAGGGYGCFKLGGKTVAAHRYVYSRAHGSIPPGLHVMHRCHNTRCVNVAHLKLGTNGDNQLDKAIAGRAPHKLGIEAVRKIRADVAAGRLQREVATEHGLHQADISNIVNRKYWRHVA